MKMKHCFPAAERNKVPILEILKKIISITATKKCLEIASGAGQHICLFAENFPNIHFYPSEEDQILLNCIDENVQSCNLNNVDPALHLDVKTEPETWLKGRVIRESLDYVYNCNMLHLVDFYGAEGLFRGSSYYLKPNGYLITYGPYADNGILKPESNVKFNENIKSVNKNNGIRDITLELVPLANKYNLFLINKFDMPANNNVLIWEKKLI